MNITDLRTPALLVNKETVKRNCKNMIERCNGLGLRLRPHMKTHKTTEGAKLMTEETRAIVVSTLAEAEFYANKGYDDIMYAYPVSPDKIPQIAQLISRLSKFFLTVDNPVILDALESYELTNGKKFSILLMVDTGYGRDGIEPDEPEALELVRRIVSCNNMSFSGLYTHNGTSYLCKNDKEIQNCAAKIRDNMVGFAEKLRSAGIDCPTVALGSTPSCSQPPESMKGITEFHPGNYIFYDYQQVLAGSCSLEDVAVCVLVRVIGHYPRKNQMLIDCGWEGMSLDSLNKSPSGFTVHFVGHPHLRLKSMSQELGTVVSEGEDLNFKQYPIGSLLKIIPYHSCATAAMHPVYHVCEGDKVIEQWTPTRGW